MRAAGSPPSEPTDRILMDFEVFNSDDNNIDKIFIRNAETHPFTALLHKIMPGYFANKAKERVISLLEGRFRKDKDVKAYITQVRNESGGLMEQSVTNLIAKARLKLTKESEQQATEVTTTGKAPQLSDVRLNLITASYLEKQENLKEALKQSNVGVDGKGNAQIDALIKKLNGEPLNRIASNNLQSMQTYVDGHPDEFHPALVAKLNAIFNQPSTENQSAQAGAPVVGLATPNSSSTTTIQQQPEKEKISHETLLNLVLELKKLEAIPMQVDFILQVLQGTSTTCSPSAEIPLQKIFVKNIPDLKTRLPAHLDSALDQIGEEIAACQGSIVTDWETAKDYRGEIVPNSVPLDPAKKIDTILTNPAQLIEALHVWLDANPKIKIERAVSRGLEPLCAAIQNPEDVVDLKNKTNLSVLLSLINIKLAPDESAEGRALQDRMQSVALTINTSIELQELAVFAKEPNRSALHAFLPYLTGAPPVTEESRRLLYQCLNRHEDFIANLSPKSRAAFFDAEDRCDAALQVVEKGGKASPKDLVTNIRHQTNLGIALSALDSPSLSVQQFIAYIDTNNPTVQRSSFWRLDDFAQRHSEAIREKIKDEALKKIFDTQLSTLRQKLTIAHTALVDA